MCSENEAISQREQNSVIVYDDKPTWHSVDFVRLGGSFDKSATSRPRLSI